MFKVVNKLHDDTVAYLIVSFRGTLLLTFVHSKFNRHMTFYIWPFKSVMFYLDNNRFTRAKKAIKCFLFKLNPKPVYYRVNSMDCDGTQAIYYRKANTHRQYCNAVDSLYEHAEGPVSISIVSEETYTKHGNKRQVFDRALEAFEEGHPHSIYYSQ